MNITKVALFFVSSSCYYTAAAFLLPSQKSFTTTTPSSSVLIQFGMANDWARGLGKAFGRSGWKQVADAFQEGLEESEINARARNAKPMEAPPSEIASSAKQQDGVVVDAEILEDDETSSSASEKKNEHASEG